MEDLPQRTRFDLRSTQSITAASYNKRYVARNGRGGTVAPPRPSRLSVRSLVLPDLELRRVEVRFGVHREVELVGARRVTRRLEVEDVPAALAERRVEAEVLVGVGASCVGRGAVRVCRDERDADGVNDLVR